MNSVTSEILLLSFVEKYCHFSLLHVFPVEIGAKSDIFPEVKQARVYNSN